ncbi:MAG: sulfatase [Candidatus Pacebacteria bacterium]|nr:sulfatase [Candidatus Paceibacterota bacterium]
MQNVKPNIVFVTTHDTGRWFGCYGRTTVVSPNIDSIAADGVLFENMFCASPVCSASRAAMMTGRYPQHNGMMLLLHQPWWWTLNEGEPHLANVLKDEGYFTRLFGFQHESEDPTEQLGFMEASKGPLGPAPKVAEEFADFMKNRPKGKPLYAQIGFWETHKPYNRDYEVREDSKGVEVPPYLNDTEEVRNDMAELQGAVGEVDKAVGMIRTAIQEAGIEDETIFIFTVDHGIEVPRAKWTCYDPGIEVAFIIRWPGGGVTGGKRKPQLLPNVDVQPTVLELAGIDIPENADGRSFAEILTTDSNDPKHSEIYGLFEDSSHRYVRTQKFKLIRNFSPKRPFEFPCDLTPKTKWEPYAFAELYDLEKDPNECVNVANDRSYEAVFADLNSKLFNWMQNTNDPLLKGPTPTPYYLQSIQAFRSDLKKA